MGVWLPNPLWIENDAVFRRLVKLRRSVDVKKYLSDVGSQIGMDGLSTRDLVWLQSLHVDLADPGIARELEVVLAWFLARETKRTGKAAPDPGPPTPKGRSMS